MENTVVFDVGDFVTVRYRSEFRIAKIYEVKYYRITVRFLDNGEERVYNKWDNRINLSTPDEIVKWKKEYHSQ